MLIAAYGGNHMKNQRQTEPLGIVNEHAAGLDIGAEEVFACVPIGADREGRSIRRFPTYTPDLHEMAVWLVACGVDTVAMESTGVYWIPVHEILEAHGIKSHIVNARHLKNVPGRKSDVKDCQWIQQLHSYGLLRGSFRPEEDMAVLRSYRRHRDDMIEHRSAHILHMQKALTLMNVRLTEVVSDITGVTGMSIIRAIVEGERDTEVLLRARRKGCKHSPEDFMKALTGNYRTEHMFALKQALSLYDSYTQVIAECDARIELQFSAMRPACDEDDQPPLGPDRKSNSHSKNASSFDSRAQMYRITGVDLTAVDGLNESTAQTILSEIGTDMSKWPTVKHFGSWLGLSPHNSISGGKILKSRTYKGSARAAQAFRLAAQSLSKSFTALGASYRRMRARMGSQQANVATAYRIARIVYYMLRDKKPYVPMSAEQYDEAQKKRELKSLTRRAAQLGYVLSPPA
jgi:transposase